MQNYDIPKIVLEVNNFSSFNSVQKDCVDKLDSSLVVSSPTASGKTIIAELFLLESVLNKKQKVIYTCPLRALASEHYKDFKNKYKDIKFSLSTGDLDSSSSYLKKFDVIFTTYEKLASLLRHNAEWLTEVGCLIVDEIHELDSDRGGVLEIAITQMRCHNPKLITLGLSATINNANELASWLDAKLVVSDFRPTILKEGVLFENKVEYNDGLIEENKFDKIFSNSLENKKQFLFFMNSRKSAENQAKKICDETKKNLSEEEKKALDKLGENILNVLEQPTEQCNSLAQAVRQGSAFHHAGLLSEQREIVEDNFKKGLIKTICATPTLCIVPETEIWQGTIGIQVKDFDDRNKRLLALKNDSLNSIRPKEILKNYNSKKIIEIESNSGNIIRVTTNHKLLIKRNKKRQIIKANEIKKTDKIATVGKLWTARPQKYKINYFTKDNPKTNKFINSELTYFIGIMLGDGCSGAQKKDNTILFKSNPSIISEDEEIFNETKKICNYLELNYSECNNSYGTKYIRLSKENWFREFLVNVGVDKGKNKFICNELKQLGKKEISALLQGLFDTDGCAEKKGHISFSNISETLIHDIQRLLLTYGIVTNLRKRKGKPLKMHKKTYYSKDYFEIIIANKKSILNFYQNIGFRIKRKQLILEEIVNKIESNKLYLECSLCKYKIYKDLFEGRTNEQKKWGEQKLLIIKLLGIKGQLTSKQIKAQLGFKPFKGEKRLDHHFELITRTRKGNSKIWELNSIGKKVFYNIQRKKINTIQNYVDCPICRKKLVHLIKLGWKEQDFEGDIYWDKIRSKKIIKKEYHLVYDVVLPNSQNNDHLFVANGFIIHNSAGINIPADVVVIPSLYRYGKWGMELISVREYKQMCFPKGTLISTNLGQIPIETIFEKKPNINVKSFNLETKKIELQPVINYYKQKTEKICRLDFSNFEKVNCTPNHPFCVLENNKFIWKPAKDLTKKDQIIVKKEISKNKLNLFFYKLFPKNCFVLNQGDLITKYCKKFKCTEKQLAKELNLNYKRMYPIKKNRKAMPFEMFNYITNKLKFTDIQKSKLLNNIKSKGGKPHIFPQKLTINFLWLVGLIATDGNINKQRKNNSDYTKIRIFNSNKEIIEKAKKILSQFNFKPSQNIRDDGNISLEVGGTLLADILNNHFGIPSGNKTTIIQTPKILEKLDPYLIGAYLSGVFDGDGNYLKKKQKRGNQSYTHRILIVTASKEFANGLCRLFNKLGIIPRVSKFNPKPLMIHDKLANFSKPTYSVIFTKIEFIKKFYKYSNITKAKFNISYSKYNNVNNRDFSSNNFDLIKLRKQKIYSTKKTVYNLEIKNNNNYFANNILVHNCGRSGRPKFSTEGKSILLAKSESQKDMYLKEFVKGRLEPIQSKLALLSVLRMHTLALIATGEINNEKTILDFFKKTLYAKQFGVISEIFEKVLGIIDDLIEKGFVEKKDDFICATPVGRRVSDLFLDPDSAYNLIKALKSKKPFNEFSYLFAWANCTEFFPKFTLTKKQEPVIFEEFNSRLKEIPFPEEQLFYETDTMPTFFSALLLEKWINEAHEQELFTDFGLAPGLLFGKTRIIEWLAYATSELSKVIGEERHISPSKKLALRTKYGVREELLSLVELKGIGRARARKLFRAGIKKPSEVKKNISIVEKLLGEKITLGLKKQLKI